MLRVINPIAKMLKHTFVFCREADVIHLRCDKLIVLREWAVRVNKKHPEVVVNHIKSNIASANRAFNKAHNGKVCFIEHELIARLYGNGSKANKRVGRSFRLVTG